MSRPSGRSRTSAFGRARPAVPFHLLETGAQLLETGLQVIDLLAKGPGALPLGPPKEASENHGRLAGGDAALPKPIFEGGIRMPKHRLDSVRALWAPHNDGTRPPT
jgi:hypothetical protein